MNKILPTILIFISFLSFGQSIGDFRSVNSGSWQDRASWEYFNGFEWINPNPSIGYPGQFNNTHIATIQAGHTISIGEEGINTQPFEELLINGNLHLTGKNSEAVFFTIKSHRIIVTPNLEPLATIEFQGKGVLQLPADGSLQVNPGGLIGDCTNNQSIYIGDFPYSVCKGGGAGASFDEVMEAGGTLNTLPSSNSPIMVGETIYLIGDYIGPPGDNLTFEWSITDPLNNTTTTTEQNPVIPNAIEGVYTATFTCFTTYSGLPYSNFETINVVVNRSTSVSGPVATAGSGATCDEIIANWEASTGAIEYFLDVATDIEFLNFVPGYNSLNVGNVLSKKVTGLTNATTYYYRVYASNGTILSPRSNTISYATLTTPNGLTAVVTAQPDCSTPTGSVTVESPYTNDIRYTYNVDGGPYQSSNRFPELSPGNHSFTIRFLTENSCISNPALATINDAPLTPTADAGTDFIKSCANNPDGKQIGAPGVEGVTYLWSPDTGLSDSTISNPIANPTQTTTYTLTATKTLGGCSATDTITIIVSIEGPGSSAGEDFTKSCATFPNGKEIGSTPQTGISYSWSPTDGLSNPIIANPIANPISSTTYVLTSTNNTNGCSSSDSVNVTVNNSPPVADAGADFTKSCLENTAGKTIGNSALPNTLYSWSPITGLSDPTIANPIANPSQTTTYTLQTTNTINECIATDSIVVTVDLAAPVAEAGNPFTKSCTAFPNGKEIGSSPQPQTTYSWSPIDGLSNPLIANPVANPALTTIYTLTATNSITGCTSTDTIEITVNTTIPLADAGADFNKTCIENPSGKTIGTRTVAGTTYSWSPTTGLSDASISNPFANPGATTTYTLTATNIQSGCSATDQITISVNNTLPPAKAGSDFTKNCLTNPNGATIGDIPSSGINYSWTPATGLSDPNIANPLANPDLTTTYTLTTTDSVNGCTNKDSVVVTVNTAKPLANAGADFNKTCVENPSGKNIGMSPENGNTYRWTPTNGLSSASIANPIANPSLTTLYTLSVSSPNGCSSSDEILVSVNITTPAAGAAGPNKTANCSNPDVEIGSIAETNTTYSWSPTTGLSDPTASNPMASPETTTTYTLISTNTLSGCGNSDSVTIAVNKSAPAAPIPSTPIQPTCDTPTASLSLSGLPQGNWTLSTYRDDVLVSNKTGFGNTISSSGLTPGSYYFIVTEAISGCSSPASQTVIINAQPPTPVRPEIGTITDPTCAVGGSVVLNNLPSSGNWTLYQGGTSTDQIQGSGSSTAVSNLLPGNYQYKVVSDKGCISPISDTVTIISVAAGATVESINHPTCTLPTGSVSFANLPETGWVITQSGAADATYTQPAPGVTTLVVTDLIPGSYIFTLDSGDICLTLNGEITIKPQPPTPGIPRVSILENPSCGNSETTLKIDNLPAANWSIQVFDLNSPFTKTIQGNGTSYTTTAILSPGDYNLNVTNEQGCISELSLPFTIISEPLPLATPIIRSITQPVCGTTTATVEIDGLPTTGTWTLHQSGSSTATYTGSGSSFSVSLLTEGNYFFNVSSTLHSCPSEPSEEVIIENAKITPTAPIIGAITQPSCVSEEASIALSGLPQGDWLLFANPAIGDGSGISGSGSTAFLQGTLIGTYTVRVQNSDGCLSEASLPFTLNPQPPTPASPILSEPIQPDCNNSSGSFVIENYDANNSYTVSPNLGVNISGNTITAPPGSYTVTAILGDCSSLPSEAVEIKDQPQTPTAPIIASVTQPSCNSSTGSVSIEGLPAGPWTLFASPPIGDSNGLAGSGTSAILTGALVGTYTLTVKNEANCISPASTPFTLNAQPPTPAVPTTSVPVQPSCEIDTGSFTITNYDPVNTYQIIPSRGVTISGDTVSAPAGNYIIIATLGDCSSPISAVIKIMPQPITSAPPTIGTLTHPNCSSDKGSVEVNGLPVGPWTLFAIPSITAEANGLEGIGPSAFYDSMPSGTYVLKVKNTEGCLSQESLPFTINAQPLTPPIPVLSDVIQPTCQSATGSFTIVNYDPTYSYTVEPSDAVVISGNLITAPPGSYAVFASLGECTSLKSQTVNIHPQPLPPTAPIVDFVTHATCESNMGSIGLSGLPQGSWILTSSGGKTLTGIGPTAILTGNSVPGTYFVTVTNNEGCTSAPSENIVLNPRPIIPGPPTVGTISQPGCLLTTGAITISDPAQGTGYQYNMDGGPYQPSATFTNVTPGIHTLAYISLSPDSCPSMTTSVEIEEPLFVNAPLIKSTVAPDCFNTGSISIEGLPTGNWTLYQSGSTEKTLSGSGPTTTVTGLEVGTYSYRVSDGTCVSKTTPNVLLKPLESTSWTGTSWTNGLPTIEKYIYMNGNYSFDVDTEMCRCQIITGFIHAREGVTIEVMDKLEVLNNANFSFDNTSSLVQNNIVNNVGKINYNRFSAPVYQSDYSLWSSPVFLQQLDQASPNTPPDKFFSFDAVSNTWKNENPINHMKISRGYSIGSPTGFNVNSSYRYPINFIGVPNNGNLITENISPGLYYLIGNPYPSAINADLFLETNKDIFNGSIYFWAHNTQSRSLRYASNDYVAYNATGGVGISSQSNTDNFTPQGTIPAAQSFFIRSKEVISALNGKFTNSMRIHGNNSEFFKPANSKKELLKDRIWLNLYNNEGAFKQTLLGYITGATNEFDSAFDAEEFNGHQFINFYSINNNKNLVIQGRALPFDQNDTVPLGFTTRVEGLFEIKIDKAEGLLVDQPVYLEDKLANVFADLKKSSYRFNTGIGTFDNRFVLHFMNETPSQEKLDRPVIVSLKDGVIKVNSFFELIDKLELYDMGGKQIKKIENININEYYIRNLHFANQPLIVKTYLHNNKIEATKIIYHTLTK